MSDSDEIYEFSQNSYISDIENIKNNDEHENKNRSISFGTIQSNSAETETNENWLGSLFLN